MIRFEDWQDNDCRLWVEFFVIIKLRHNIAAYLLEVVGYRNVNVLCILYNAWSDFIQEFAMSTWASQPMREPCFKASLRNSLQP